MNPENDNSKDQGEILAFMKDMKKESESMMKDFPEETQETLKESS